MTTIDIQIKSISAINARIADINNRIDNVSNVDEYDELVAERQIELIKMRGAINAFQKIVEIEIDANEDVMSESAHDLKMKKIINEFLK